MDTLTLGDFHPPLALRLALVACTLSLSHFCSQNIVKSEAHCVLECPLYNITSGSTRQSQILLFGQPIDISLYFMKASTPHHSRESAKFLTPS